MNGETPEPAPAKPSSKAGVGPVLGIIIIILLLALGGLYYFTKGVDEIRDQNADQTETAVTPEDEAAVIETQGTTANLNDIEADVGATDFSGLDAASVDVEASLQTQ